jgi:hypothetical protein
MSHPEDSPPPASTHKICANEETAEGETQSPQKRGEKREVHVIIRRGGRADPRDN